MTSSKSKTTDFHADELVAPEWINLDFLLKVLKNCESEGKVIKIKNSKISPATMKGDHYASVMFRAHVEYAIDGASKTRSLIIKTMPELEGHKKEMFGKSDIFVREISMYTEVLPRFEQILREVGDETVLKANCLYHALVPKQVIVLEDLLPLGYEMVRDRRLTEVEARAAFTKLAKWHAISYKINLEEPHYFDKFQNGLFNLPGMAQQDFMITGIKYFVEILRCTPTLHQYLPYFEYLQPLLIEKCRELTAEYRTAPQSQAYYVLCHGDFHDKNMLFKFHKQQSGGAGGGGDGAAEDILFIDFQICFIGSLAFDWIYSIYLLLDEELRLKSPAFLYYYFTIFTETLKKIGFKGQMPKLTTIRAELMRFKYLEMYFLTTILPMFYATKVLSDELDMESAMISAEYRRKLYDSKEYIKYVEKALSHYLHRGYFDD